MFVTYTSMIWRTKSKTPNGLFRVLEKASQLSCEAFFIAKKEFAVGKREDFATIGFSFLMTVYSCLLQTFLPLPTLLNSIIKA